MVGPSGFEFRARQLIPKASHVVHRDVVEDDQALLGLARPVQFPLLRDLGVRVVRIDEHQVSPVKITDPAHAWGVKDRQIQVVARESRNFLRVLCASA